MLCISVSPPGESLQAPWKLPGSHDARGVAVDAENGDRERPGNTTTETKASTQTKLTARAWWHATGMDFHSAIYSS